MKALIAWFAENRVAANLMMVIILVIGAISLASTSKEILPKVDLNFITVGVIYPGASPREVERAVISRLERAIADIPGINNIRSVSQEQMGQVSIEVLAGFDVKEIKQEIQSRVENVTGLPESVKPPVVRQVALKRDLATNIVLYGQAKDRSLKILAEKVQSRVLDLPSVTQVAIGNTKPYEITIEVSELALERYGISFSEIASAVRRQTLNSVSGAVDLPGGRSSIMAVGKNLEAASLEDLVVRSLPDGGQILLQDLARISDGFEDSHYSALYNGEPAVYLSIYRVGSQNILKIVKEVEQLVEELPNFLPEGVSADIWQDLSRHYKSRINLLIENAMVGLALLFLILTLFLNLRLSFWVTLGIPIAFMGAFCLLPQFGGSFNMISLFAFILVLGIVVDDAIIVGENIFTFQKRGNNLLQDSIAGAQEVYKPVFFAVITTMVMFSPMLFLPGNEGKLMKIIPMVVISILAFSLIESFFILPAHLSSGSLLKSRFFKRFEFNFFSNIMDSFLHKVYKPVLEVCLSWRYSISVFFVVIFLCNLALLTGGWMKTSFFSSIEADTLVVNITFPVGTPIEKTSVAVHQYEKSAMQLGEILKQEMGEKVFKNIVSLFGQQTLGKGENLGAVVVELMPSEERQLSGESVVRRWRELSGSSHGNYEVTFETTLNKPGPELDIELLSRDSDQLLSAANALKVKLSEYEGVYDIKDTFEQGQQEIQLRMKDVAIELGVRISELASQVSQAFHGIELTTVQRGYEDVKVMLRYGSEQNSLWHLENMSVSLPDGSRVPLHMLASVELADGPRFINRSKGKRSVRVSAYVDPILTETSTVTSSLKADFLDQIYMIYPDVEWQYSGMQQAKKRFLEKLFVGFLVALLIMYGLMATLFKSYMQPLIVLYAVPFGMLGAVLGHGLLGMDVTLWSLVGMVAVSGVVVNDNLVLVDYINRTNRAGYTVFEAVRDAGIARFRPVFLTTVTTFSGLTPLMLETSIQAKFLIPMAVSLAFGVLFATFVSLILVPVTYYIFFDIQWLFGFSEQNIDTSPVKKPVNIPQVAQKTLTADSSADQTIPFFEQMDKPVVSGMRKQQEKQAVEVFKPKVESAYQQGYRQGAAGGGKIMPNYQSQELEKSWASGWRDGVLEYTQKLGKEKSKLI